MQDRRSVFRCLPALLFAAALVILPGTRPAVAAADAGAFVQDLGNRAISLLTGKDLSEAERQKRFRGLLREGFDVERIGRFVLGPYVRQASAEELKEYQALFEDLIVATYAARFAEYRGQTFAVNRVATGDGQGDSVVVTSINPREGGPPVRVDWQVRENGKAFRIVDVRVEGVSMSVTQRNEFTAVIRQGGGDVGVLIAALRDKTATLRAD